MAQWLKPHAPSVARAFQQAGYATGHFGKWHLGGQRDVGEAPLITEYGFDESLTQFEGLGDRVLALLDDRSGQPHRKMPLGVGSEKLGRGNIRWTDRAEVTSEFVRAALDFMQQAESSEKPFFVQIWPDDVHSPFFPEKELRGDGSKRALYHGVLVSLDQQLKALFDRIRSSPTLRDNTLVIVCSDNGPEPGAGSAGPFRGHKGMLYEGGIRSPMIVWGPGLVSEKARGTMDDTSVVTAVDLAPSLLSLAGMKAPATSAMDGIDRSAVITGNTPSKRNRPMFWIRPPDRPEDQGRDLPDLAVRDGNWKLLMNEDGTGVELYDLAKDHHEDSNVAAQQPSVVETLTKAVTSWHQSVQAAAASIGSERP